MKTVALKQYISSAMIWKCVLPIVLGLSVFVYWRYSYPSMMAYQEQFQLFLFDSHYLAERVGLPGGVVTYVAEFLTQFYNTPFFGALVISLLMVGAQQLSWLLMCANKREGAGVAAYILSFMPSLVLWRMMSDESLLLAYVVSFVVVQAAMSFAPKKKMPLIVYAIFAIPIFYWLAGPMAVMLAVYIGLQLLRASDRHLEGISFVVLSVVYVILCIVLSAYLLPYPTVRLFMGIFYYRSIEVPMLVMCVVPMLLLLLTIVAAIPMKAKAATVIAVAAVAIAAFMLKGAMDEQKYELMDYDCLVRQQRWADIVAKAEKKSPNLPMSVCATNIALAMTGQLGDRCFDFFQHGTEGLLPEFERNFNTILVTGDTFFMLGLINTAQRFAFEAMEAIPNYNKNSRVIKRLAETNLINGQYKVAEKYLMMLQKTIFYKKWADKRMEMIHNPKLIDAHPMYGYLRRVRLKDDLLFSDKEMDKFCGQLVMHNKENVVAIQYLLMYPLLNKDLNTFMQYYGYVQSVAKYNSRACDEAVALAYAQIERYKNSSVWRYFLK